MAGLLETSRRGRLTDSKSHWGGNTNIVVVFRIERKQNLAGIVGFMSKQAK
jgi:hypothetical protein